MKRGRSREIVGVGLLVAAGIALVVLTAAPLVFADRALWAVPLFVTTGAYGIYYAIWSARERAANPPSRLASPTIGASTPIPASAGAEAKELEGERPAAQKLDAGFTSLVMFGGLAGWFALQASSAWLPALVALLSAFALAGLYAAVRSLLALRNPRLRVTMEPGELPLGRAATIRWHLEGSVERLTALALDLVGSEFVEAGDREDRDFRERVFARIPVYRSHRGEPFAGGSATLHVPRDSMHTFWTARSGITWKLVAEGTNRSGPGFCETFRIDVVPVPPEDL